jgi:hypothetical protein
VLVEFVQSANFLAFVGRNLRSLEGGQDGRCGLFESVVNHLSIKPLNTAPAHVVIAKASKFARVNNGLGAAEDSVWLFCNAKCVFGDFWGA